MTKLLIKCINLAAIVVLLVFYNFVLLQRTHTEEIDRLHAELEKYRLLYQDTAANETEALYTDGVYTGTAPGYAGDITVQVTVENGRISQVEVISAPQEDAIYMMLAQSVTDRIVEDQTFGVDIVSGASFSSKGIINASEKALEGAVLE